MANQSQQLDAPFEEASQTPDVPRDWRERILGAGARKGGSLEKAVMAHHQARLDEAQMYRRNMASIRALLQHGTDPKTLQPLNDDERQRYENQYQAAKAAYQKIMGVNKQTKAALAQQDAVMGHMMRQGPSAMSQPPTPGATASPPGGVAPGETPAGASAGPGPAPGGGTEAPTAQMSAPPAIAPQKPNTLYQRTSDLAVSPQSTTTNAAGAKIENAVAGPIPGKTTMAPPPSVTPPEEDQLDLATRLPFERQAAERETAFGQVKRAEELKRDMKVAEAEATAKAKAKYGGGTGVPPRPVPVRPLTVRDARTLANSGYEFVDEDNQPIDVAKLPDEMSLMGFKVRVPEEDDEGNVRQVWKTQYALISPNQRTVTFNGIVHAVNPGDISKTGAATELGAQRVPTTTLTTDPVTRQTTVKRTIPQTGGATGTAGGAPAAAGPVSSRGPRSGATPSAGAPPVTSDGLIDPNWNGASPQVIEGANQLIQDRDVDKIPSKTRELSAALARRAGWYQGRFTPKEQVLLKEATTFLQRAASDPSLAVLDSTKSKLKLGQVAAASSGKEGFIGRTLGTLAAGTETPQEAAFMRMYNQLVGTVSGLSQLVRSGRATEAQIERLKAELPSIIQSPNSADARARIQRLLSEVSLAMERGQFQGTRPDMAPPPSPGGGSVDDEIMRAVSAARH